MILYNDFSRGTNFPEFPEFPELNLDSGKIYADQFLLFKDRPPSLNIISAAISSLIRKALITGVY